MPGPSLSPGPAGDWGVNLRGSFVSLTCDCDCDPTVNPAMHVQNGLVHFFCRESTQIRENNQGLLP